MRTIINISHILRNRKTAVVSLLAVLAIVAAGCSTSDEASDRLRIVATTTIWGDVVAQVVGDEADVEALMPVGADPHDFEASSSDVADMVAADLVVANGLGLEEGMESVLENAEESGATILRIGEHLDGILPYGDATMEACEESLEHDHEDENHADHGDEGADHDEDEDHADHDHEHGSCDPHVWMDPLMVSQAVDELVEHLNEIAPDVDWESRGADYQAELQDTADAMEATLESVPDDARKLVTNHEALQYFAERFGFEVIATVIPGGSTLADPSSGELADLVETIEHEGVGAIFAETSDSDVLAEAVASEAGDDVEVVVLYTGSLGAPDSDASTLIAMLETDASLVADALGG